MDRNILKSTIFEVHGADEADIQAFLALFEKRQLKAGTVLAKENDAQTEGFVVEHGTIGRYKLGDGAAQARIGEILVGGTSGFLHMIERDPAFAELRADVDTVVWVLTYEKFQPFVLARPAFAYKLLGAFAREIRSLYKATRQLGQRAAGDQTIWVGVFSSTAWFREALSEVKTEGLSFRFFEEKLESHTAVLANSCDVVCCFVNDNVDAEVIDKLAQIGVKMVAMRCAGFDRVDIPRAKTYELTVARVPAYSPYAVAEHAVALLMSVNRKTHRATQRTKESNFNLEGLLGWDLHGKTAGIIGTGKIGCCLIDILLGFGCRVICYDVFINQALATRAGVSYVSLDEVLAQSDFISLHVPLLASTKHMINADSIAKMKPGVTLINTSRGGLIDTPALIAALQSGHVRGAGLDVYENESEFFFYDRSNSPIKDSTLLQLQSLPNVVLTGHQAFFTKEAIVGIAQVTVDNIRAWAAGKRGKTHPNSVYQ